VNSFCLPLQAFLQLSVLSPHQALAAEVRAFIIV
jgi:hypothetical protein